ncbi:MAG: preprotein translocase subunit SecG [Bacilli bacterium]|jgi:preprotein translocase subunit SecG|nr:preprotein translocase subunit SecG [Bacilli bacterium]MDD2682172.1 preprotein translocase subunit SecG [Bacilli bacterium]MDD3121824.1 preprotein translocase subunit SecG [Bacilli bacterium]MDD4063802.1 preprotein translocase subunit SecG [Bacilli bacterium]MDD4482669.1 preprotein translocase subunit SecG [Bacilli bacterium]
MQIVDILLLVVSVLLISIIILQRSNEDASQAFTGRKSELFANKKERGLDVWISRVIAFLSVSFFILAILAAFFVERI